MTGTDERAGRWISDGGATDGHARGDRGTKRFQDTSRAPVQSARTVVLAGSVPRQRVQLESPSLRASLPRSFWLGPFRPAAGDEGNMSRARCGPACLDRSGLARSDRQPATSATDWSRARCGPHLPRSFWPPAAGDECN